MQSESDLQPVDLQDVPWIVEAARRFSDWLIEVDQRHNKGRTWNLDNMRSPFSYEWTVGFITYEDLFVEFWTEPWFQDGMSAYLLLGLERRTEMAFNFFKCESGDLVVVCPDGVKVTVDEFLKGESLAFRHDPEFACLNWEPVATLSHILDEYSPDAQE